VAGVRRVADLDLLDVGAAVDLDLVVHHHLDHDRSLRGVGRAARCVADLHAGVDEHHGHHRVPAVDDRADHPVHDVEHDVDHGTNRAGRAGAGPR
jgi:hypothetical protein